LNRLVPNGMLGGVRGGRNFPLLDCAEAVEGTVLNKMKKVLIT